MKLVSILTLNKKEDRTQKYKKLLYKLVVKFIKNDKNLNLLSEIHILDIYHFTLHIIKYMKILSTLFVLFIATTAFGQQLYFENFSNGMPSGYTVYDADGLTANSNLQGAWTPPGTPFIVAGYDGSNGGAMSASWFEAPAAADDWLITPAITLGEASKLNWKSIAGTGAPYNDGYTVYISTVGVDSLDFLANDPLFSIPGEDTLLTSHSVDLANLGYANQTVHFAFRNTTYDGYFLFIDDIEVINASTLLSTQEYSIVPKTQYSSFPLGANVTNTENIAINDFVLTAHIFKDSIVNNTPLNSLNSSTTALGAGSSSVVSCGDFDNFDEGVYFFQYILNGTGLTNPDTMVNYLIVSDSLYARDQVELNNDIDGSLGINAGVVAILGQNFDILSSNSRMSSVLFLTGGQEAGDTTQVLIYDTNSNGTPNQVIGSSEEYIFSNDSLQLRTVEVYDANGNSLILDNGTYFVALRDFYSTDNVGLAFTEGLYTPNKTFGSINNQPFSTMEDLDFKLAFVLRPYILDGNSTSTKNIEGLTEFNIFPNPAQDFTNVKATFESSKRVGLSIVDTQGKLIQYIAPSKTNYFEENIDLRSLSNGVYILSLYVDGKTTAKTIMKF